MKPLVLILQRDMQQLMSDSENVQKGQEILEFNDLKKLRMALGEAYTNPSDLQQLVIDWGRFKKEIYQIQKSMQQPQQRRKNHTWLATAP